eukprot:COSAG01_NODE_2882_length_6914_cov_40.714894_8_plen_300_part_00
MAKKRKVRRSKKKKKRTMKFRRAPSKIPANRIVDSNQYLNIQRQFAEMGAGHDKRPLRVPQFAINIHTGGGGGDNWRNKSVEQREAEADKARRFATPDVAQPGEAGTPPLNPDDDTTSKSNQSLRRRRRREESRRRRQRDADQLSSSGGDNFSYSRSGLVTISPRFSAQEPDPERTASPQRPPRPSGSPSPIPRRTLADSVASVQRSDSRPLTPTAPTRLRQAQFRAPSPHPGSSGRARSPTRLSVQAVDVAGLGGARGRIQERRQRSFSRGLSAVRSSLSSKFNTSSQYSVINPDDEE